MIFLAILGVIPRECPAAPLGELLFEVQTCKTDADCWPRVCCPDGTRSYCRTARARLDLVPVANRIEERKIDNSTEFNKFPEKAGCVLTLRPYCSLPTLPYGG